MSENSKSPNVYRAAADEIDRWHADPSKWAPYHSDAVAEVIDLSPRIAEKRMASLPARKHGTNIPNHRRR